MSSAKIGIVSFRTYIRNQKQRLRSRCVCKIETRFILTSGVEIVWLPRHALAFGRGIDPPKATKPKVKNISILCNTGMDIVLSFLSARHACLDDGI